MKKRTRTKKSAVACRKGDKVQIVRTDKWETKPELLGKVGEVIDAYASDDGELCYVSLDDGDGYILGYWAFPQELKTLGAR